MGTTSGINKEKRGSRNKSPTMTFVIHLKQEKSFVGLTGIQTQQICKLQGGKKVGYLLLEISTGKQDVKTEAPINSQQFEEIISARGTRDVCCSHLNNKLL